LSVLGCRLTVIEVYRLGLNPKNFP